VEQQPEPVALFTEESPRLDGQAVVRDLARRHRIAADLRDGTDVDVVGIEVGEGANIAKWLCADAGFQAADQAMQTLGGFGYAKEYHVERYWREARLQRIAPVTQEMTLNYLAQNVLGLPRSY
jgi:alkylation response protein AidB-like acyl-CoA dehydrogenase